MSLQQILAEGIAQLGIDVDAQTQTRLLQYLALLHKWNRVHNLTAVREPKKMVTQHILDCLAVLPHIEGKRLVDVGSGGGLPGIPLALARPQLEVTLLDSNHKKTVFLQQAVIDLQLTNVKVVCARVEDFKPQQPFDLVISRAFSDLGEFARLTRHLCAPGAALLAMKGLHPYEEIAQLPADVSVQQMLSLKVPGLGATRHLVVMRVA
jgi:16S rRNA (guanine527-N7)-methyltransferase